MEHLLFQCENHSMLVWREYSTLLTAALRRLSGNPDIPRMDHTPLHIIYNVPHPSILTNVQCDRTRRNLLQLLQELKRDIIYRRMNLAGNKSPVPLPRIHAHILSVIVKQKSLMEYRGLREESSDPVRMISIMCEEIQTLIE